MHDEWTEKLSEYLDDELSPRERESVEAHLQTCGDCSRTLEELRHVVASAQALKARPPSNDLWAGVAKRTVAASPRTFSFTLPQLAAASILLACVSAGVAWQFSFSTSASPADGIAVVSNDEPGTLSGVVEPVSLADQEYAAAVSDLEKALQDGRGVLDEATIATVEQNLAIINVAIEQARQALEVDPSNGYVSGHLFETRRKKLDLLRRAAAMVADASGSQS